MRKPSSSQAAARSLFVSAGQGEMAVHQVDLHAAHFEQRLEATGGGRKLALQNGKVEGSEVGKNTALFLEAGVKSPLYVVLCPDPPAREEREERRKDERQRGEREREEREMREI